MMDNSFNFMFTLFPTLFSVFFIVFIVIMLMNLLRGISEWNKNNHQPVLSVTAKVVVKRTSTSRHHHQHHSSDVTSYYTTFEFESGDRLELRISGSEFGMLAEGDLGKLTFQGTRYHGFERQKG